MAVKLLNSYSAIDKKLVIQLLTVLAEKCPLHQEEVVSNGAAPVLVEMLRRDESVCKAASQVIHLFVFFSFCLVVRLSAV